MSPFKARQVVDLIRGKALSEALAILKFTPRRAVEPVRKVVESAAANAENNLGASREDLWVAQAYVDGGPSMKRMRPGSMGRTGIILHRTSHITVVVSDENGPRPHHVASPAQAPARPRRSGKEGK
jgi:large subunit ribosomal protein L22